MLIAIDPPVFVASLTEHALEQVRNNLDIVRVVLDDSQVIIKEYYKILEKYMDSHIDYIGINLLQQILLTQDDILLPLPTELAASSRDILRNYKYTTIEEKLLRIAANAKHLKLRLLLAGTGINTRLPDRELNNPRARRALKKEIPWLDVRFASDRKELFAAPPMIHCNARLFEFMVARVLQTQHEKLRCIETPEGVKDQLGKAEEIDLYGYEEDGDRLTVWIGECKLREEGRENKLITISEIAQLRRKMSAAGQYERNRTDLAAKSVQIRGLMISNALDLFDDFVIQEILTLRAEFWQAELTSGWTTDLHWYISRLSRIL